MKKRIGKLKIGYIILIILCYIINAFYEVVKENSATNELIEKMVKYIYSIKIVLLIGVIIGGIVFLYGYIKSECKITRKNLFVYNGEIEFKRIDFFINRGFYKSNEYYLSALRIIDEVYTGYVIKNLVKKKNLEEFYRRKAFLNNNAQYNDLGVNVGNTIAISLMTSLIFEMFKNFNLGIKLVVDLFMTFVCVIIVLQVVFGTIYTYKGVDSGFKEELFTYEIKKIEEKIQEIQKNLVEENDVEKLKKVVLSSLTQLDVKGWKKKEKEILECDINDIYEIREESIVTTNKVAVQIGENSVSLYFDEAKVKKAYKIYLNKCNAEYKKAMKKSKFVKSIKEEWEVEKYLNDDSKKIFDYMKKYNIAIKI